MFPLDPPSAFDGPSRLIVFGACGTAMLQCADSLLHTKLLKALTSMTRHHRVLVRGWLNKRAKVMWKRKLVFVVQPCDLFYFEDASLDGFVGHIDLKALKITWKGPDGALSRDPSADNVSGFEIERSSGRVDSFMSIDRDVDSFARVFSVVDDLLHGSLMTTVDSLSDEAADGTSVLVDNNGTLLRRSREVAKMALDGVPCALRPALWSMLSCAANVVAGPDREWRGARCGGALALRPCVGDLGRQGGTRCTGPRGSTA